MGKRKATRQEQNKLDQLYKENPHTFFSDRLWTYDPSKENPHLKFKLYPFQKKILQSLVFAIRNGDDVLIDKCRQTGLTWLIAGFIVWGLLFVESFTALVISYKQKLVDDGSLFSIFGRMEYMINRLPNRYKLQLEKKYSQIKNIKNNAYVIGESTTTKSSRGGTFKFGFWDEVAHTDHADTIYAAFSESCKSKCFVSTPNGKNFFYHLRFDVPMKYKHTVHWNDDPRKTLSWYKDKKIKLPPELFASEVEVDYVSSITGKILKLDPSIHLKNVDWVENDSNEMIIAWDFGLTDLTVGLVMVMDWSGDIFIMDELVGNNLEIRFYIDLICGVEPTREFELMDDVRRKVYSDFLNRSRERNYRHLRNIAGHEANMRSILGKKSVKQQFKEAGNLRFVESMNRRYVNLGFTSFYSEVDDRIAIVRQYTNPSHNYVYISEHCKETWDHLLVWSRKHDEASHFGDAFSYGMYHLRKKDRVRKGLVKEKKSSVSPALNKLQTTRFFRW